MLPDVGHSGRCADSYWRVDISIGFIIGLIIKNQKPIQVVCWSESTTSLILVVALIRRPAWPKKISMKVFTVYRWDFLSQFISTRVG